jgi:hypothetical protein
LFWRVEERRDAVKEVISALVALSVLVATPSALAADPSLSQKDQNILQTSIRAEKATPQFKILTDYPGRARLVTDQQKAEIQAVLAKSDANTKFICTGIRLEGNPQAMNLVVRLRAKLVCEYAQSLRPDMSFWYHTIPTQARNFNGRVMVFSR